jgi:D-alanine-D-alanine ligase
MEMQQSGFEFHPGSPESGSLRKFDLELKIEHLLPRLRLAVVFGGDKSEPGSVLYQADNSRPWKSYEEVAVDIADSLKRIGFRHVDLMPDDLSFPDRLRRANSHMAWLNTGGVQGYNPTAHTASLLEMLGVPYVGHDPHAVTTLDNKHSFKAEAVCAGLPTARFSVWDMTRGAFRPEINSRFGRAFSDYEGPFVVKPVSGRASLHVHLIGDRKRLPDAVDQVYKATRNLVLIEEYLPGREFCVAVCGPVISLQRRLFERDRPFVFSTIERVLESNEKIFTSMDVRPITHSRVRILDEDKEGHLIRQLQQLGADVFREFNLNSITRIDVRAGVDGRLQILEANPKPDLKRPENGRTNLISAGLPTCGMDYEDLILSLFADRLDYLLKHRNLSVNHIVDLLNPISMPVEEIGRHNAVMHQGGNDVPGREMGAASCRADEDFNEAITNANVRILQDLISSAEHNAKGDELPTSKGPSTRRTA